MKAAFLQDMKGKEAVCPCGLPCVAWDLSKVQSLRPHPALQEKNLHLACRVASAHVEIGQALP